MDDNRDISSRIKILCLEEDRETLQRYQEYFSSTPYTVHYADKAEQGISLITEEIPDLIFYDIHLAGKQDFSIYQQIETNSFLKQSVIILVANSVQALHGWKQLADLPGVHDYLIKPICKDELLLKVNLSLRSKYMQDNYLKSTQKLTKALRYIKRIKTDFDQANSALVSERAMLENSLKQIAFIIDDRAKSIEKLETLSKIQERDGKALVEILSNAIELKDSYHRGHSKKVAEISCYIARELNLPEKVIQDIEMAAHLYGLGRLSLSDTMARKIPCDYTATEKAFVRNQPVETASLLNNFSGFHTIARIIKHFHENFDGTGIPDGLKRDEIPIGSRILAGADLYDYLVYRRKGSALQDAFQLIEKEVNARLDAQVVYCLHKYATDNPVTELERARQIKLSELESGMELAAGIYTQNGTKLLPINTILKKELIWQLAQYAERESLEENVFIK